MAWKITVDHLDPVTVSDDAVESFRDAVDAVLESGRPAWVTLNEAPSNLRRSLLLVQPTSSVLLSFVGSNW